MANVTTSISTSSVAGSSQGTTRAVNLDWMNGAPIAVTVTGSSSGTFAYTIQYTLDDLMQTPAASVTWVSDSNVTAATSNSSGAIVYSQPLAGIRLNSTSMSSAVLTMKVNQGLWL
jgi:hypothetical protein